MTQIEIIVEPAQLFDLVNLFAETYNLNIIFRRFKNKSHGDGWMVVPGAAATPEMYTGYDAYEMYLCDGMVPAGETDSRFMKEAAERLIIITGGHLVKKDLELTVFRIFHKQSVLKKAFTWLKKEVDKTLKKEEVYLAGKPYNTIWFDEAAWKYNVYYNINGKKIRITKEV